MRKILSGATALLVTASAVAAPFGNSDNGKLFPYAPKAKAELNGTTRGCLPSLIAAKQSKQAKEKGVAVDLLKAPQANVFAKATDAGYLDGPDGTIWFYTLDNVSEIVDNGVFKKEVITGFKLTVFDSKLNNLGTIEDNIDLQDGETGIVDINVGAAVTQKFFNYDNSYEVMIGIATNTTQYVNHYRTQVYSIGNNEPIANFEGYYCSAINTATDAWSENFYITFMTSDPTETPSVNGVENDLDYHFKTYKKAGYSGMGDPVLDVRFPGVTIAGADAMPFLATQKNGVPYFAVSHLKYSWYEDPLDYNNENPTPDNELIVDLYSPASAWASTIDKYSTTTFSMAEATADNLFFLYFGNFRYDDDLNLTLNADGTPALYITRAHTQRGGDSFTYDYEVYDAAAKGTTAAGVKKFDIASGVSGGYFMQDIAGFAPQVMFLNISADGSDITMSFVNTATGETENTINALVDAERNLWLTEGTNRIKDGNSYVYYSAQTRGASDDEGNVHTGIVFVNPDGTVKGYDDVNMGKNVQHAQLYSGYDAFDPYIFNLDDNREYMALIKRSQDGTSSLKEELSIFSTDATKAPLLTISSEEGKGDLAMISLVNLATSKPVLAVTYVDHSDWKYTLQTYDLPLVKFENGEGTLENPYEISTVGGLKQMFAAPDAHFAVVSDIDANGYDLAIEDYQFNGSLDGRNHLISNLNLNGRALIPYLYHPSEEGEAETSGVIRNLKFLNATLNATHDNQGLVVGTLNGGKVENVHVYAGRVTSDADVAGLVGNAYTFAKIHSCSFSGDVEGSEDSSVAGIVVSTRTSATVQACAFEGNITGGQTIGGIVASLEANGGAVSNCHVNANIKGKHTIGGIAGDSGRALIENCHVEGTIEGTQAPMWGGGPKLGGIVGSLATFYGSGDETGEGEETTPSVAVKGCYANLTSISYTGDDLGEEEFTGQNDTMHRIVGHSCVNEEPEPIGYDPDWNPIYGDPAGPDAGLVDNYAVGTLELGSTTVEPATTSTEGASVAADETGISFFQELGWNYGYETENPWNMTGNQFNPALYFEGGLLLFTPAQAEVEVNKTVTLVLKLVGKTITEDMLGDFSFNIADESVVEVGNMEFVEDGIAITFTGLKLGTTNVTVNLAGHQAEAMITVKAASGVENVVGDAANEVVVTVNGGIVEAQSCNIEVYSISGILMGAGHDTLDLNDLAKGIYVIRAVSANGESKSLKIRL